MEKMNTDLLFYWARKMGVKIIFTKLKKGCLGRANAAKKIIKLDVSLADDHRALEAVFSEEIGHVLFPPRPGHIRYHSKDFHEREDCSVVKNTVAQDERKTLDWATVFYWGMSIYV